MNIVIANEDLFILNKMLELKSRKIEELEVLLNSHREVCDRINSIINKFKRNNLKYDFNNAYLSSYRLVDYLLSTHESLIQENTNLKEKIKRLEEDFPKWLLGQSLNFLLLIYLIILNKKEITNDTL